MTITDFIRERAKETYAEPRCQLHDGITAMMGEKVAAMLKPGASILDIGCGQGAALEFFRERGFLAWGTTMNLHDAKELQEKNLPWSRLDMHEMTSGDWSHDCIWARHVLEHSIAPFYVISEFYRILRPGGILYAEMPGPDTSCQHHTNPNHYSIMPASSWMALIDKAGFENIEGCGINIHTGAGPDQYISITANKPK